MIVVRSRDTQCLVHASVLGQSELLLVRFEEARMTLCQHYPSLTGDE